MTKSVIPVALAVVVLGSVAILAYTSVGDSNGAQYQSLKAKLSEKDAKKAEEEAEEAEDAFYHARGGSEVCSDPDFSKSTLKAAIPPRPFAGMFKNLKGQRKFEASDVIKVSRDGVDQFYVVFDNLFSIARIDGTAPIHDDRNALIGTPGVDSGYEAIVYDNVSDTFFVTIEAVSVGNAMRLHEGKKVDEKDDGEPFVSVVREMKLPATGGDAITEEPVSCPVDFAFPSSNKGFEGMFLHRTGDSHDDLYLFGLCEGNHCAGGKEGRDVGNGRLIVLKWHGEDSKGATPPKQLSGARCWWESIGTIKLPKEIAFIDYSAVAFNPKTMDMAITSQENAAVWVGKIDLSSRNPEKWGVKDEGKVYNFPRDGTCRITNCNIEGVAWVGENVLAVVSDKMKSGGAQDFRCQQSDQSFQEFVLP